MLKVALTLRKYAPNILVVGGIALAVGRAILAYKNSIKARKSLEDANDRLKKIDHGEEAVIDGIILDTKTQARDVLDELDCIIKKYGRASVSDLYDIVGLTGDWADTRSGWTSIRSALIKPVQDGFMLILPKTERLLND